MTAQGTDEPVAWPTVVELAKPVMADDPAFTAWTHAMPDKHWAKYDLSAVRLGYELAKAVNRPSPAEAATVELRRDAERFRMARKKLMLDHGDEQQLDRAIAALNDRAHKEKPE